MTEYSLVTWPVKPSAANTTGQGKWHIVMETQPTALCGRLVPNDVYTDTDDGWSVETTCERCTHAFLEELIIIG